MRIVEALKILKYARLHYRCRWLFWTDGFCVGRHNFFRKKKHYVSYALELHELRHVEQCSRYRVYGSWLIAVVRFWFVYVWQWVTVGFRYSRIPFEIEARAAESGQ